MSFIRNRMYAAAAIMLAASALVTACDTGQSATPTAVTVVVTPTAAASEATATTAATATAVPVVPTDSPTTEATATEQATEAPTETTGAPSPTTPAGNPSEYTWSQLGLAANKISSVSVLPFGPHTALAVGPQGAWRSAYPYTNWQKLSVTLQGNNQVADAASDQLMFITTHSGCASGAPIKDFRSTDGGTTWTPIGGNVALLKIVAANASVAYGISCTGVAKSTDAGATWTNLPKSHIDNYDPATLAIGPDGQALVVAYYSEGGTVRIMRSDETVDNWTDVTPKSQEVRAPVMFAVAPAKEGRPDLGGVYMASSPNVVWLLAEGTSDWKVISESPQSTSEKPEAAYTVSGLYVDLTNSVAYNKPGPIVYEARVQQGAESAQGLGVYRTADGGQTWQELGKGLEPQVVNSLALSAEDAADQAGQNDILLAGTEKGIWGTTMPPPFH